MGATRRSSGKRRKFLERERGGEERSREGKRERF